MSRRVIVGLTAVCAIGTLSGVHTAAAADVSNGFSVAGGPAGPLSLQPGVVVGTQFSVIDTATVPEHITVTVTGVHFDGQDAPQYSGQPSPGLSVTARPTDLLLAPGASHDVVVNLVAAPGTRPGALTAGIVFRQVVAESANATTVVPAQARVLIGHLPGPVSDDGRIDAFRPDQPQEPPDRATFRLVFTDTGTIDYRLGGTVTLTRGGKVLGAGAVPPAHVLPGDTQSVPITYSQSLAPGPLDAAVTLQWGTDLEHTGTAHAAVIITGSAPGVAPAPNGPGPSGQRVFAVTRPSTWGVGAWLVFGLALLLLLLLLAELLRRLRERARERRRRAETRN